MKKISAKDSDYLDGPVKVENIHVYHGANYFSGGPIVLFRVNLGAYDEVFTNGIDGFYEKLSALIPTLYEHFCSVGHKGGFFIRVKARHVVGSCDVACCHRVANPCRNGCRLRKNAKHTYAGCL